MAKIPRLWGATLALALAACAVPVEVDPQGGGRYEISVDNDFGARLKGAESVLGKKAEELCPDGYDRLRRRSVHPRHGLGESINWIIQCS
jgi:hypothetical protein